MAREIDPNFIKKIREVIGFLDGDGRLSEYEKISIALQVQMLLQLDRQFDMLRIATGLTDDDILDGLADTIPPHDTSGVDRISQDASNDEEEQITLTDKIKVAMSKSVMCGNCGKGVIPNPMGYCPKCGNDLQKQVGLEMLKIRKPNE